MKFISVSQLCFVLGTQVGINQMGKKYKIKAPQRTQGLYFVNGVQINIFSEALVVIISSEIFFFVLSSVLSASHHKVAIEEPPKTTIRQWFPIIPSPS